MREYVHVRDDNQLESKEDELILFLDLDKNV